MTAEENPTEPVPTTMSAVVARRYGGPEVLELARIPVPTPEADQVLIAVDAAGIDRGTWHLVRGEPYMIRLAFGLRRPKQPVPGLDVSGSVVAVGADVTRFAVGDAVMGVADGSLAQFAVAREDKLVARPDDLSAEAAAVVSISGTTALTAVVDKADVGAGQKVLILGASGGVGSYATQMAAAAGAIVTGVASGAKADAVRELGATTVIDYTTTDPVDGSEIYDVIIDIGGLHPVRTLRRCLTAAGTLVLVGGEGGGKVTGGIGRSIRGVVGGRFSRQSIVMFVASEHHEVLRRVVDMVESGAVVPRVSATYSLISAADALRDMEDGRLTGKAVVSIRSGDR